jgi:hypothetical protein
MCPLIEWYEKHTYFLKVQKKKSLHLLILKQGWTFATSLFFSGNESSADIAVSQ